MALDPAPLAELAARFMDELEEEHGGDVELRGFAIAVELDLEEGENLVQVRCPDETRVTEAVGLLFRGTEAVAASPEPAS